jgi:hypothetical protein
MWKVEQLLEPRGSVFPRNCRIVEICDYIRQEAVTLPRGQITFGMEGRESRDFGTTEHGEPTCGREVIK